MKEIWYFTLVILMLSILGGFVSMTPTTAAVVNLPPTWDTQSEFKVDDQFELNLQHAFFDPDADPLSFSVSPSPGISAGLNGDTLIIIPDQSGTVTITASDGKTQVSKTIRIIH